MFSGAQISLYPMSDDFVGIIMGALGALDPYRDRLRIETDDVSTLLVGTPDIVLTAMRDLFVAASAGGVHVVLSAALSRGCPGEPDDPLCAVPQDTGLRPPLAEREAAGLAAIAAAPVTGQSVAAQLSLHVLGTEAHMDEIADCIGFLRRSGVFERPKNFCTKLRGDAGAVFAAVEAAFTRFGAPEGHVAVDLTVSANSPTVL